MTTLYYFCAAGDVIDTNDCWYQVTIGTTVQAERDLQFLKDYAEAHNYYFERRSLESSQFVQRVAQSLFPSDDAMPLLSLKCAHVKARDLVRAIKSNNKPDAQMTDEHSRHHSMMELSLNYRAFRAVAKREKRNANA